MSLRDVELKTHYESGIDDLIDDFYVPVLSEATQYDRFASYFTSVSLAALAIGLIEFVENEGQIRIAVNTALDEEDLKVLRGEREAPTESLRDIFGPDQAESEVEEIRWKVLAWLLANDRLEVKVCDTPDELLGIFHSKLGILQDEDENIVTFEGSNNETFGGLIGNYERFKTHCSWKPGQGEYVDGDVETFDNVWNARHDFVETYDVPEAIERGIVEEAPEDKQELIDAAERVLPERIKDTFKPRDSDKLTEHDTAEILNYAGKAVGGTHVAETASTVEPWPHQRIVSDTLYTTYPKGFLLCDEVGLGKTIEAGLTLSRLIHTDEIQSCLILAPSNLTTQWQEELFEKFNLNTYLYDRSANDYVFTDALGREHQAPDDVDSDYAWSNSPIWRFVHEKNTNGEPAVVLASWHLARMSRHQDKFIPEGNGTIRTVDDVEPSCRGRTRNNREGVWDLTIVDEAHKARRRNFRNVVEDAQGTPNNLLSLLRDLKNYSQCRYLLTATPMQVHSIELYDLLSLVGIPEEWDDPKRFLDFYHTRIAIAEVLEDNATDYTGEANFKDGSVVKQQTLNPDQDFLTRVADRLNLDRDHARSLVLRACEMVRAYDRHQDHNVYPDELLQDIRTSNEQRALQYLLRAEDAYVGMADRRKLSQAIENLTLDGWQIVLRAFGEATPVDVVLHRNTRDILREYHRAGLLSEEDRVPTRKVHNQYLELNGASDTYEHIEDYVKKFYKRAQEADDEHVQTTGLVMTVYRQRMTSSFYAIQQSLESRLGKLESARETIRDAIDRQAQLDDWFDHPSLEGDVSASEATELFDDMEELDNIIGVNPDDLDGSLQLIDEEIEELDSFIDQVRDIITDQDPKLVRLREDIQHVNEQGRDRVMVFTQYGDTLDVIRESLVLNFGRQVGCYSGRGGEMYVDGEWKNVGKERVKQEFSRDDGDVEILVCTESASHGLNLQRCGVVINADAGWNPMTLEQRIGRIDRIGQQYDEIWIYNYFYEDTVESDVYEALEDRVGLFQEYVGGMQPIISNVESQIEQAAMEGGDVDLDAEDVDESYDHIRSLMEYRVVEEARLNGWEDYVHPDIGAVSATKDYPHEIPVIADFVEGAFTENEVFLESGVELELVDEIEEGRVYRLEVPNDEGMDWVADYAIEPQEGTLADEFTTGGEDLIEVVVTFDPAVFDEYPSVRLFSFGDGLFERLVGFTHRHSKSPSTTELVRLDRNASEVSTGDWFVCGWVNGTESDDGSFVVDREVIPEWVEDKTVLEGKIPH